MWKIREYLGVPGTILPLPSKCLVKSTCSCKFWLISKRLSYNWNKDRIQIGRALREKHGHIELLMISLILYRSIHFILKISHVFPLEYSVLVKLIHFFGGVSTKATMD